MILSTLSLSAQKSKIGLGLGASLYYGDLSNEGLKNNIEQIHPAIQIFYSYSMNQHLKSKISIGASTLSGDDSKSNKTWQKERNFSFKSSIYEISGVLEYNLFNDRSRVNPYIFGGLNGFHYNPKTMYNGEWIYLQPLGTEGQILPNHPEKRKYNLNEFSIVFGAGLKFRFNNSIMVSFEIGWRRTNTDYIDDVSGAYVNFYELYRNNGEISANLSDRTNEYFGTNNYVERKPEELRGNSKIRDYYSMSFINFAYTLNSGNPFKSFGGVSCPKF